MDDLDVIKEIEKEIGVTLPALNELNSNSIGYLNNKFEKVIGLGLPKCNICEIKKIISFLLKLNDLTALNLNNNDINDISLIAELNNLTFLLLDSNNICDISPIAKLNNLKILGLVFNQINDISSFTDLKSLENLYLSGNNLIKNFSPLENLQSLIEFQAEWTSISDISPIKELNNLKLLNLAHNQINDISYIKDLKSIERLDLSGNRLIMDISHLTMLESLITLHLTNTGINDISPLRNLKRLTEFHAGYTSIIDISPLKDLINLKTLFLEHTKITDLSPLIKLKVLKTLILFTCNISDISPLKELYNITELWLSANKITEISPLKGLLNLEELHLDHNPIEKLEKWILDFRMDIKWECGWGKHICLGNNPLISPPIDIVKKGKKAIKEYFYEEEPKADEGNDLEILYQYEKERGRKFKMVDISEIIDLKYDFKDSFSIDKNNNVIGLAISDTFDKIPNIIIEFKNLTHLNIKCNDISTIYRLTNLTHLNLSQEDVITPLRGIKMDAFNAITGQKGEDNSMGRFHKLMSFRISDISPLASLSKLVYLNLNDNYISDLYPLMTLKKIKYLMVSYNKISDLSPVRNLFRKDDFYFELENNPLTTPPTEIVQQGKPAINDYFLQLEKEKGKTEYLFEAKLLVIGEGGTGKTTFTRKIQDVNANMPREKDTTLGIEVGKWNYEIDFPKLPDLGRVKFNVNLWDFGGQKIYQGTHQIFFTDKSFYVLIDDTREQKTDFSYWLNTVEQLGGEDSSLIIVLNKRYNRKHTFDESGFRKHFGKLIREVIELDMKKDKTGMIDLQDKVKMYLKQLPGIGDALPPSWVNIRKDLLKEKGNFISFDRFREICAAHDITDNSMIHTLSGYYNRIGAFTHYINDPVLQERIYLNSNWLVKTVYEVLDNETAKVKKGRLTETDIKQIWGNNELHYEVNKLTQLMHKFGLMYHIPCSENYVVPAHLPTITPYETWAHEQSPGILQFIYEFDKYMPQGIMSRLIVALHHHIKNHDHVWHRGVNIEANGAHAEIKESYGGSNRFEIRIAGTNKIELLATIRERFAEVLQPFNNLNYKQLVPCICNECKNSVEPAFHEYKKLLEIREKGKGKGSQCNKTFEIIDVDELFKITEPKPKIINDDFAEKINDLLANGKLNEALDLLLPLAAKEDKEIYTDLIGIKARYTGNENDFNKGIISVDEYKRTKALILQAILHTISMLNKIN